ncbi:MAG: alpha/beta hydrolase [Anaerolineales bacterium]|nr:alpha/beta hydrolase [Anaerolineales bacterium]
MTQHTYGTSNFLTLEDGRKLHYWLRGEGGPTVVFEAGMGFSGSMWGMVQLEVAKLATTLVYDRAGTGRSDDRPGAHTLEMAAADLGALLASLPQLAPFILVGSSWGGPIVRHLAAKDELPIRALVLVDQSDENAPDFFTPSARKQFEATPKMLIPMAKLGLYKLMGQGVGKHQPPDVRKDHYEYDFTVRAAENFAAEISNFITDMEWLRDNPNRLEGIEVSVISGMKAGLLDGKQRKSINAAHRNTADYLAQARFVPAENAGHYVMFHQPELIVSEVARLLGK